ncbi:MAG: hypothetical protein A2W11_12350 [Ignavibacteria bacterium RBG_16_35_7]|nr:MAG: hypothetical protein A2W11_12350 [Ignavibacteria bacterium RBG_16_35_7]
MNSIVIKVSKYVIEKFNNSLPEGVTYHDLVHTLEVVREVKKIGKYLGTTSEQMEMLLVAGWFHDMGYIDNYEDHEERSAEVCKDYLLEQGYPKNKISRIGQMIRSTKIPQKPSNLLEKILCDADLVHIGKKGFSSRSRLLRNEWENMCGKKFSDMEWIKTNIQFLSQNKFRTSYAKLHYDQQLRKNLLQLREQLKNYKITPPPKHKSLS